MFLPMNLPLETAHRVFEAQQYKPVDVVINLEEIKGCESVAALLVRSGGLVCHTNIGNAYSKGMLIADLSLIHIYARHDGHHFESGAER